MNQYTNQISKLKSFPKLSIFGRRKRKKQNFFIQQAANQIKMLQDIETAKKTARVQKDIDDKNKKLSGFDKTVESFDKTFTDVRLAYNPPPKAKKVREEKEPELIPQRPVIDPGPAPTQEQLKLYREYDSKGIFFKTNLESVTARDNNGNAIIKIGEEIVDSISVNGEKPVIVDTIKAPKSGHVSIPLNVNRKE